MFPTTNKAVLLPLLLASLFSPCLGRDDNWIVGQIVNTTSGPLKGKGSSWKPLVSEYLGIPYAQPPVGSLRFRAPQPYTPYDIAEVVVTRTQGSSCPVNIQVPDGNEVVYDTFAQTLLGRLGQIEDTFDEDCLTLNVWTKPQSGEKKKAVMVWIYGGGFNSGSTTNPAYDGAALADQHDVVVVSMNYRTNIFGFPRADFLEDQNLGLLDQRLAVEWIRDNIEKFGGDASRITLFGQSAGGASVDYYSMAWTKDPIVNAFIAESGFSINGTPPTPAANLSAGWYLASQSLGCGGVDQGEDTLECMQSQTWQNISAVLTKRGVTPDSGSGGFGPIVDGKVVFEDVSVRRKQGRFIHKPLLIGATSNEAAFYKLLASVRGLPTENITNLIHCGPGPVATSRLIHDIPAWRYVYAGEYPNQEIGFDGAWHGSEIGMVFGTSEYHSRRANTPDQGVLSDTMMLAWTSFAKQPWYGLRMMGWPIYNSTEPTVIRLGEPDTGEISFDVSGNYLEGCPPSSYWGLD